MLQTGNIINIGASRRARTHGRTRARRRRPSSQPGDLGAATKYSTNGGGGGGGETERASETLDKWCAGQQQHSPHHNGRAMTAGRVTDMSVNSQGFVSFGPLWPCLV